MLNLTSLKITSFFSEDTIYKWHFIHRYKYELYLKHTLAQYANCIFCSRLKRSSCHKHCLKCTAGTYIHCSPLLPGLLYFERSYPFNSDQLAVPWYYKNTCSSFKRLSSFSYLKNFYISHPFIGIQNLEVFEGLEKGLSSGERPCHVCALIDYNIFRTCCANEDFDKYSPCQKISLLFNSIYQNCHSG